MKKFTLPSAGSLLLSDPFLIDPNFKRSVVLLCEHQGNGSVGFILSRPLNLKLKDAIPEIEEFDAPLYYGGPVQTDTMHYIHNLGDQIPGSVMIADGVYWGGDFEQVKSMIANGEVSPENFRFFLGYTGWDKKQLNTELNENSWMVKRMDYSNIFQDKPEDLWKSILQGMGGKYKLISTYPEDPSLN